MKMRSVCFSCDSITLGRRCCLPHGRTLIKAGQKCIVTIHHTVTDWLILEVRIVWTICKTTGTDNFFSKHNVVLERGGMKCGRRRVAVCFTCSATTKLSLDLKSLFTIISFYPLLFYLLNVLQSILKKRNTIEKKKKTFSTQGKIQQNILGLTLNLTVLPPVKDSTLKGACSNI